MNSLPKIRLIALAMLTGFWFQTIAAYENTAEWWRRYGEQRDAIYERMKRHGITRADLAAMRLLLETAPPYSDPHVSILAEKLLRPGEHYRIEMDEYILTMKVPDAPVAGSWIWPYTDTRQPDPKMEEFVKQSKGVLKVADLAWYACNSIFPPGLFGRCEVMGVSMAYRIVNPEDQEALSTPEKLRALRAKIQKTSIPTQEDIDRAIREHLIDNREAYEIVLAPEPVVINGRIWIRDARNNSFGRGYFYSTYLQPDRALVIQFGLPQYAYKADPDLSTYPGWIRRAYARLEEMIASLHIVKTDDDGSPDPFVIERVEPAPLPVREKPPSLPE